MASKWDERPDAFLRARLDLIKALHRKSLLEREETVPAAPKPPLPAELDAAWDTLRKSR
jgi:hypothetical protein